MDDLVQRALARWPNVPAIAGWLKLTTQGEWLLTGPEATGLHISNSRILNFIARNYSLDNQGRSCFQNGPQKVFVDLELTPWVYRLYPLDDGTLMLHTHTGLIVLPEALWTDELGRLYCQTPLGLGLLHASDVELFSGGLRESEEGTGMLHHQAQWTIPDNLQALPAQRIEWRLAKGQAVGTFLRRFELTAMRSDLLAGYFQFVTQPKV